MAASVETGMSKPEMKSVLKRSSREDPISCALGQGENNALALLLLDKRKQPRALEGELKKAFPDVRNNRFGTAFVDTNEDGKMVQVQLNRPVSGMAKRLVKTLKKTGYTKVRLLTEDGSLMEEMEEEDPDAEAEAAQGAAAAAPAAAPAANGVPAAPPPPPEPAATAPVADAGALAKRLAALAAQIPAAAGDDAERKKVLSKLATDANVNIKTNNLTYAANSLAQLEKALAGGAAAAPAAPPAPPPAPPAAEKPAADAGALSKRLAALIGQIPGAAGEDAARKATLMKLATDANVNIKTNNLTYAANFLAQLEKALAGGAPAAPPPPEAAAKPAADAGALAKRLAALIGQIPGAAGEDAARKATLMKLATDANVNIKTNNLTYAANFLVQLEKALAGGAAAPGAAAAPDLSKTRATWAGVRQQVVADVDKLRAALATAYDGQPVAGEVLSKFGTIVAPLLARFNTRVEDALDAVMKADAAGRGAMLDQARAEVKDALAFASSDKLIGDLDDNPFVPLGIRAAATAGLTAVQQAVQ